MLLDQQVTKGNIRRKVVEEVWTGNDVDYSSLRVFRYPTYAHIAKEKRSKLDAKSRQYIFLGYQKGVKGFKLRI